MNCDACAGTMPPDARFCPSCGTPHAPSASVEERKLVTVVFCDLVGSTELSEALDPETLRSVTLRYFAAMSASIEQFGGTVEKFIGDAVMAVFGVPTMHEDDATRAAAAALAMLDALAALNAELETSLGVRLRVRIGVNTGPAVTSTDVSTRQALVSGDTVNTAARLEQNAGEGEILIGPVTWCAVGPAARTESVGPLRLKGKAAATTAYRLLALGEDPPDAGRRFDLPFVGREVELGELDRALAAASDLGPVLATVQGEPGIGKTRLVREWLDRAGSPVPYGAGRCRPYGDHGSLAPLAEAVNQLLAGPAGADVTDTGALAVLNGGLLEDGTPGASLDGTCAALGRILAEASGQRPVVLALDDCQWATETLLDTVDRLVAGSERAAVLIVALTRFDLAERRPEWGGAGRHPLTLAGLSADASEAVIAGLSDGAVLGPALTARMLESAGGNPFHLEQLLAALTEADPSDPPDPSGRAARADRSGSANETSQMPHSLQALLGARIDALAPAERAALDLAAVLGREFAPHHVTALADTGPEGERGGPLHVGVPAGAEPVADALARLGRRRLVEPWTSATAPGASFRFSNGLIHEAAYLAMAKRTRAQRHERAAGLLAERGQAAATVAVHMEKAYRYRSELGEQDERTRGLRSDAARLFAEAGAQALTRSDLVWAEALLERAVELSAGGSQWATAARRLGEVRIAGGRVEEGRTLLQSVLDACPTPVESAHARLALAVSDPASAVGSTAQIARELSAVFEAASDDLGRARTRIRTAQEQQFQGRHALATRLLSEGLDHAERCGAEPERALALGAFGVSLWRGPVPVPEAIARCRDLLADHGAPRPVVQMTLRCPLAVLLALGDQEHAARAVLAAARRSADELGYAEAAAVLPIFEAAVEALAGHPESALLFLDRAAKAAADIGAGVLSGTIARESARLLLDRGRHAEAAVLLAAVTGPAELLRSDAADIDGLRARLAAAAGDTDEAVRLAERSVAAAGETDSPILRAVAELDRADVLESAGRHGEAVSAAHAALRCFQAKGHLPGVRRAAALRTRLESSLENSLESSAPEPARTRKG